MAGVGAVCGGMFELGLVVHRMECADGQFNAGYTFA